MRAIDADSVLRQMMRGYELMMEQMADRSAEVRGAMEDARLLFTYAVHDEPTLDVAPVRHGRWEQDYELVQGMEDNSEYPYVACNLCGHKEYDVDLNDYTDYDDLPKFCPNCGAKMDDGQENEDNGDNADE